MAARGAGGAGRGIAEFPMVGNDRQDRKSRGPDIRRYARDKLREGDHGWTQMNGNGSGQGQRLRREQPSHRRTGGTVTTAGGPAKELIPSGVALGAGPRITPLRGVARDDSMAGARARGRRGGWRRGPRRRRRCGAGRELGVPRASPLFYCKKTNHRFQVSRASGWNKNTCFIPHLGRGVNVRVAMEI